MIEFYYILIKNNGDIIHDVFATSHGDLINKYITPDDVKNNTFLKAKYSPIIGHRLDDVKNYNLLIYEQFIPKWFNDKFKTNVINKLQNIINKMIVRGRKKLLLHEGVILSNDVIIEEVKHSIIFGMYGNAKIIKLDYATVIHDMTDNCIVEEMKDGTKIMQMWGYSKVLKMYNYSKIMQMYGQAKVGQMYDNSRIITLKGDANILKMQDKAHADRLKHTSRVLEMHGHSVIEEMWDWTIVDKMFDNARINFMDNDAIIKEMNDNTMIDEMFGNSIIKKLNQNSLVRKLNNAAKILEKELK